MASTIFRPTNFTLRALSDNIKRGDIALPELQRPFVWANAKVRDLFDSLYKGFPVGYLLFWETGAEIGARQVGVDNKDAKVARWLIVDGQQRLTSLYSVLEAANVVREDYSESRVQLAFRPKDAHFAVWDITAERNPEFLKDISQLWVSYRDTVAKFIADYETARGPLDQETRNAWEDALDHVRDLQSYPFNVLELDSSVSEEDVAEVFTRINFEGVRLNQADFILTLMSVFWEAGRKELEAFSRACKIPKVSGSSPFNWYITPSPDQMLRVSVALAFKRAVLRHAYSILRGKDLVTGIVTAESREAQFKRLRDAQQQVLDLTNWHEYLLCLERAGYRGAKMISSENTVLFTYAIWLIGRTEYKVPLDKLREVTARWFFMAHATSRYSGSFESRVESDFVLIDELATDIGYVAALDRIINDTVTSDFWTISLPNALSTSAAKSPALLAYLAALNILDADALLSSGKVRSRLDPAITAKKGIERHHLFPKAHLQRQGVTDTRLINQIANMALVEWNDNIAISDSAPADYWPKQLASKTYLTPNQLARQEHIHALPAAWTGMEYLEFLTQRRKLMAAIVREGFSLLSATDYQATYPQVSPIPQAIDVSEPTDAAHVSLLDLVTSGLLPAGTVLIPSGGGDGIAEIDANGTILVNDESYLTPTSAAAAAGAGHVNGWMYWVADTPSGERLLDSLRAEFRLANVTAAAGTTTDLAQGDSNIESDGN